MTLTCTQMDVLLSFYIENDLSNALKKQVEEHLTICPSCRAKYEIIKTMIVDLRESMEKEEDSINNELDNKNNYSYSSAQYQIFKNNLSAYIDNELPSDENIKIKKFTINNPKARKELEQNYNIRKLMNDSFKKSRSFAKQDFSKNVLKQLELEEEATLGIHPAIKIIIAFTTSVLLLSCLILISLGV